MLNIIPDREKSTGIKKIHVVENTTTITWKPYRKPLTKSATNSSKALQHIFFFKKTFQRPYTRLHLKENNKIAINWKEIVSSVIHNLQLVRILHYFSWLQDMLYWPVTSFQLNFINSSIVRKSLTAQWTTVTAKKSPLFSYICL